MKRFARIAVPLGAALVALVLAIAASATTSKADKTEKAQMGAAPQAVTNYLAYTHGKAGKANPKLSKVYIGWVNQQGGQVVIGGLATAGASLAVDYVNQYLGGVGGHPVQLVPCFIKSAEEEGTTCGQKFVNDKRISVVAEGAVATGAQSMHATIGANEADRHRRRHHPGQRSIEDRRRPLRRRPAHPAAVRELREERPPCEDGRGRLPELAGRRGVGTGDRERPEGMPASPPSRSATRRAPT